MASQADLLLLSQAVKDIPYGTTPNAPAGWSVSSVKYDDLTGMMAAAFKSNSSSEIVIGYQATNLSSGSSTWRDAQLAADKQITLGNNPKAYDAALDFAQGVRDANPGAQISVAGFSLGGGEAQFVASVTGFGGASYGGPGIVGYTYNSINSNFESYINYGDLIAMWGGLHVGVVKFVGSPLFLAPEALLSPAGSALVLDYTHDLSTYANNIIGSGTPQIPANVYFPAEFGVGTLFGATSGYPKFSGDLNTQFSVLSDGTLVTTFYAPDGTLVGNRTTGTDGNRSVSLFATSGQSWINETGFLNPKGQLNSINVQQANGDVASTKLDISDTQAWSSETLVKDVNGALKTQTDVLDSLSRYTKYFDIQNTHPYKELDVAEGADGKVTAAQVVLDSNTIATAGSIGQIFGSALGAALGGTDQLSKLISGTVGGAVGSLIAQKFIQVLATSMTADLSKVSLTDVFALKGVDIANAGIGAVSSFLTAELGSALHIGGFGGQLFNIAGSSLTFSVLSQVANSNLTFDAAIAAIDWGQAVSGAINAAELNIDGILGGYLAHEFVTAKTHEGAIGGELLGAIGNLILPGGLGSLIGTILGTLIGNHFGTAPSPGAVDLLDQAGYYYNYREYQISDHGTYTVPDAMAPAADTIINAYLKAVNGVALDHSKQVIVGYIQNPDLLFLSGTPGNANHSFTDANDAVHAAALDVLRHTEVIGGDLLLKRAHQRVRSRPRAQRYRMHLAFAAAANWESIQPKRCASFG
jgi:hypothetical protein